MTYYNKKRASIAYFQLCDMYQKSRITHTSGPEALARLMTYVKYHVDSSQSTLEETLKALREDMVSNPRPDAPYIAPYKLVYVPPKTGPKGHKASWKKVYGEFPEQVDFYSLVRFYLETYRCFITKRQKAEQRRLNAYWTWRSSERCKNIVNEIAGNGWNKSYVRNHYSHDTYDMICQWDDEQKLADGVGLFRTEYSHGSKYTDKQKARMEAIQARLDSGLELSRADKVWMERNS